MQLLFAPIVALVLLLIVQPSQALCNGAAAVSCCVTVAPASDPLVALQLFLANITAPTPDTVIGLGCVPVTAESGRCLTKLVGCDDNSHAILGVGIGVGCGLNLQAA
ncbi:unnamed protein product [Somion occarium]|uniref:Hydrophobin n=1 Tax=Somion occarium TaxID=3059160 RepID=A0ABP1DSG6_9APHY